MLYRRECLTAGFEYVLDVRTEEHRFLHDAGYRGGVRLLRQVAVLGPHDDGRVLAHWQGLATPVGAQPAERGRDLIALSVNADALGAVFTTALPLAVLAGLLGGKVAGILGASVLAVKLRLAEKPRGMGWRDMAALSVLGGVGFTVSLLIAELALPEGASELAKAAVLIASVTASLLAAALLLRRSKVHARISDTVSPGAEPQTPAGGEPPGPPNCDTL